jgi:hypothetical protein
MKTFHKSRSLDMNINEAYGGFLFNSVQTSSFQRKMTIFSNNSAELFGGVKNPSVYILEQNRTDFRQSSINHTSDSAL